MPIQTYRPPYRISPEGAFNGQVTEVLPALETVFISGLEPWGPVLEAISEFVDARQLSGHPLSIHWEGEVHVGEQGHGSSGR